jgi:hypothetical protein
LAHDYGVLAAKFVSPRRHGLSLTLPRRRQQAPICGGVLRLAHVNDDGCARNADKARELGYIYGCC